MSELEAIPREAGERLEAIGQASLVIGLPGVASAEALESAVHAIHGAFPSGSPALSPVIVHSEIGATVDRSGESSLRFLPYPLPPVDRFPALPGPTARDAFRTLLSIGQKLNARACVMLCSEPHSLNAAGVRAIIQPVLDLEFDLAAPIYPAHKFEGLINTGIVYPFTRALYGKRIHSPMAVDFAFSARLTERLLQPDFVRPGPLAWLTTRAVCDGLQVCQVNLDFQPSPPSKDAVDLSSALSSVLGSLFLDVERNAPFWQRMRGSQAVRTFGAAGQVSEGSSVVDVRRMIESFQLGYRNLLEIWGLILSPATMLEMRKLAHMPPETFRFPDDVWVRLVYDFALGHRLRVINRDHLLRALTPPYLAWVASYALEVQNASPLEVADRVERLCFAYEVQKPYLLSRWRWPDRFNP